MKENPELTNSRPYFTEIRSNDNKHLNNLGAPHVDSFNHMLRNGLKDIVETMKPFEFVMLNGDNVEIKFLDIHIEKPCVPEKAIVRTKKIYPAECRQRKMTYSGMLTVKIGWSVNGVVKQPIDRDLGEIPIMLRSDACNLSNLSPEEMIKHGEHENEWGGYFIIKGHEKLLRMLIMTRKNFPVLVKRGTWKDKGVHFSNLGIQIRCVNSTLNATTNILHYVTNGTVRYMFSIRKRMYYVPVILILKALVNYTDEFIYNTLIKDHEDDQYYTTCIENMLRDLHEQELHTQKQCKNYLGKLLRLNFYKYPESGSDEGIVDIIFKKSLLIQLDTNLDKFNLIIHMMQKLFQGVQSKVKVENADGVMMHELLLGGHLYQKVLDDRLSSYLSFLQSLIEKRDTVLSVTDMIQAIKQCGTTEKYMHNFLATGNLNTKNNLGLMQTSGLAIHAENISRTRYMSHFRAVHRGAFFVDMRTTEVRQLLPDAWGFICPVHTPDGTPCGLLNHLTGNCIVSTKPDKEKVDNIAVILISLGMVPNNSPLLASMTDLCIILLESKVLGFIKQCNAIDVVNKLRILKIKGEEIPPLTEIAYVPYKRNGQFSGIFLFVESARMMRPVINVLANEIEYIGTFEQVYLDICIHREEEYKGLTTHMEISKTSFLSNLANLIPMPDCNQSPRNMYQCQMSKQTMGTPCHNWPLQAETKLYRLQTPTTPLFRPVHHDYMGMDDFPMGINAVVAVISYTGYDMEDAMIINKSSEEFGLAHASIYKTSFIEIPRFCYFARDPYAPELIEFLDTDGLPHPGTKLDHNSYLYCYFNTDEGVYKSVQCKGKEDCVVDSVKLCGSFNAQDPPIACITIRNQRNPSVGDKFASRAGQKGVLSQKWPAEDMPFTESGLTPDIVFNPHGFPSRMTIAMMIEIMAGKSGSVHGRVHDATPFRFTEKDTAIDYFGKLLESGGYNYYGNERMYSGINGCEIKADIFFGIVHYQRLRHMVNDKFQARSTGAVDPVTRQPVKGRKRGGGVRFGEMERDALLAHGTSFILQDRLLHCSDKVSVLICRKCGSLQGPIEEIVKRTASIGLVSTPSKCRLCDDDSTTDYVEIPYIFKYLITQLSSVNINVRLNVKSI